jgi:hypothetical protein
MSTFEDGFIEGWQLVVGREAAIGIPRSKPLNAGYSDGYSLGFNQALDLVVEQMSRRPGVYQENWVEHLFTTSRSSAPNQRCP